jgi:hypothetical protein
MRLRIAFGPIGAGSRSNMRGAPLHRFESNARSAFVKSVDSSRPIGSKCVTISEWGAITRQDRKNDAGTHRTRKALACEMTEDQPQARTREIKCCRGSCQLPLQLITRYSSVPLPTMGEAAVSDVALVSGLVSVGLSVSTSPFLRASSNGKVNHLSGEIIGATRRVLETPSHTLCFLRCLL